MRRDLLAYQKSLNLELQAAMSRVRHLIGGTHWLTDGEHKESVLRQVLKNRLPASATVGTGFVCFPSGELSGSSRSPSQSTGTDDPVTSRQIDILITATSEPSLYRDGDLAFVTPEAVLTLIEVKTKLTASTLEKALRKLARDAAAVRRLGRRSAWASLFVYEEGDLDPSKVLETLAKTAKNGIGAVNCLALGPDWFFRFWEDGHKVGGEDGPVWHAYELNNLAPGYFVGNIAVSLGGELSESSERLWFPIEGTKETRRVAYVSLNDKKPRNF